MTERERKQQALLDKVDDERRRVRGDRVRRALRITAWSVAALVPQAVVAWLVDGTVIEAHSTWSGLAMGVLLFTGLGVAGEVVGWLGAQDSDAAELRTAEREHRDHELDAWKETRRKDLRNRQLLLDDLDDARDTLRRIRRQLIGSAVPVAVFLGAVGAEIGWLGDAWWTDWTARLLVFATVSFGAAAVEILVSLLWTKRLSAAKANLLVAQRRHRDTALFDAKPPGARREVAELPPLMRHGMSFAVFTSLVLLGAVVVTSYYRLPVAAPTPVAAAPAAGQPSVRKSSVPVDWPSGVAMAPDGKRAYVANSGPHEHPDANVAVFDFATQKVITTVPVAPHPMSLALSPDGRRLVAVSDGSSAAPAGALTIVDTATLRVVATVPLASTSGNVTVSPDGRTAWCSVAGAGPYDPGSAVAVDLATAKVVASVPVGLDPGGIAIAPDGARLYVSNFGANTVSVVDPAARKLVSTVDVGAGPSGLVVDGRRHTVWVADESESDVHRSLTAIDTTTLAAKSVDLGAPAKGVGGAVVVALTPDGRRLLVGRYSPASDPLPTLAPVDPDTRRVTDVLTLQWAFRIAVSADGHHAILSSGDLWVLDLP